MIEFELVTNFFAVIPWLSLAFIIVGTVLTIILSVWLGWRMGKDPIRHKSAKLWFALGWIPLFAIFSAFVFCGSYTYYTARGDLGEQVKEVSNISIVTLVRGNDHAFVGNAPDGRLVICNASPTKQSWTYKIICN